MSERVREAGVFKENVLLPKNVQTAVGSGRKGAVLSY